PFETVCTQKEKPIVYKRGELLVAVNPAGASLDTGVDVSGKEILYAIGEVKADGSLVMGEQSFVVLK
ncbi:MAG: glycosylase, partial [Blautia sp.]|nr:glycosylase [Blautia sp.]